MVCKIVEQPFDTVKVLQQTQGYYKNWMDCFGKTIKQKGFMSLYKGVTCPLIGSVAECAVTFVSYDFFKNIFKFKPNDKYGKIKQLICSASCAGVCIACVQTPAELLKCKIQVLQGVTNNGSYTHYNGSLDAFLHVLKEEGIRGLFRGNLSTIYREIPGDIAWFGTYEFVTNKLACYRGGKDKLNVLDVSLAGGLAGITYWTAFYPADTVKSNLQTDINWKDMSFRKAFIRICKESGIRGLYKGLLITLIKAFPTNAALFVSYDYTFKLLNKLYL
ncbi:hypothetical protein WA158_000971 [Blastocystis sp. Blastoise]